MTTSRWVRYHTMHHHKRHACSRCAGARAHTALVPALVLATLLAEIHRRLGTHIHMGTATTPERRLPDDDGNMAHDGPPPRARHMNVFVLSLPTHPRMPLWPHHITVVSWGAVHRCGSCL